MFRRLPVALTLAAALCAAVPLASATAAPSQTGLAHKHKHVCAAKSATDSVCTSEVVTDASGARPAATPTFQNAGYTPVDLQGAYRLTAAASANGAGKTVAIVDAYDLPTAAHDLNTYRAQFGLPLVNSGTGTPAFTKINQTGGVTPPAVDSGWGQEIALDLEMASAICPNCNILLVEASTSSMADLAASVNTAARTAGVVAISNSYGGGDYYPNSAYNHPGIAITASSGDSGYGASYPASDPHVVAVGGTSLNRTNNSRGWAETAWSGAGSGCSSYNTKPSWQANANTGCSRRGEADVSAVADPSTGVAVYDSTPDSTGTQGWMVFGGTSVASPIVGSVYALAHDVASISYPASKLYSTTSALNDVTSGSNGSCRTSAWCHARTGWDGPTGLGTPSGLGAF